MPFVTQTLPSLMQGLFDLLEGRRATFPSFKLRMGAPVFLGGLFRVALTGNEAEKIRGFDCLYSIAVAFKKLKGPYKPSVLAKQFSEFQAVDNELLDMDLFSEDRFEILELARRIIRGTTKGLTLDGARCLPRPGPGATNVPIDKHMRYRPHRLYAQIEKCLSFWDGWFSSHPWDVVSQSDIYRSALSRMINEPSSRFKFVPKTAGKARGICIEENEVQFLQQAIRRLITDGILHDKFLKRRIALNDQQVNANLALVNSFTKDMATIDMSDASDRVSRDLVSWLFQDNKELHDALMALSTKWIEPPKEAGTAVLMKTNKFAPMGSALCFPVMSLVHYALCRAIILMSSVTDAYRKSREVYVYGDDIVIPTDCYDAVIDWLPRFGMKLNKTKSFVYSHFRESCGIHALQGHNVTPVYVKHVPTHRNVGALSSMLQVESDLKKKGFHRTAALHQRRIQKFFGKLPEVPMHSAVIGFKRPSLPTCGSPVLRGAARKSRWNQDLQCFEYQSLVLRTRVTDTIAPTQNEAYLKWLTLGGVDSERFGDAEEEVLLSSQWMPASAFGVSTPLEIRGVRFYRPHVLAEAPSVS